VFTWQQNNRQNELEDQRARQAQNIENQRAKAERELATQRAQDEALQAYLDQMSTLLLEKNLRASEEDSEVRTLARARTLTVLNRLDSVRKERLLQFLYEAGLLHKGKPVINLNGADLSGINLHNNNLSGGDSFSFTASYSQIVSIETEPKKAANLSGTILSNANLEHAFLWYTDLSETDLSDTNLSYAYLGGTDLSNANLQYANLSHATFAGADLSGADLSIADVSGTDPSKEPKFSKNVDMSSTILKDTNLSGANLSEVNLSDAKEVTEDQLAQAKSLKGATMPDGQKYEDWLKSKGSGENEEKE
jgi:uncharacterized protein YjbI with pentapeptide repeats